MNTFISETSGPGRRVSVWADRRFLLPDTSVEPGRIFFTGNLSGLTVGPDVGRDLALAEVTRRKLAFCMYFGPNTDETMVHLHNIFSALYRDSLLQLGCRWKGVCLTCVWFSYSVFDIAKLTMSSSFISHSSVVLCI